MSNVDIPIFTKSYELYKIFYSYLTTFPKKDRYTLGQRCENILLDFIETVMLAGSHPKQGKLPILKQASIKLDLLKVLFRLEKDLMILDFVLYFFY